MAVHPLALPMQQLVLLKGGCRRRTMASMEEDITHRCCGKRVRSLVVASGWARIPKDGMLNQSFVTTLPQATITMITPSRWEAESNQEASANLRLRHLKMQKH